MHLHYIEDENGELVESISLCSDSCHRDYAEADYNGWNGCHETEFTTFCQQCGVVIPGSDACSCQIQNVVVNRFRSESGEKCEHGNWIQVPYSFVTY